MRRHDREILNQNEINEILINASTIRVGFKGEEYPYIVPVSFGYDIKDGLPILYFHCAKEGLKLDYLKQNPKVCVEADRFYKIEKLEHGITTRYESVIGFGKCQIITDLNVKKEGLKRILDHYNQKDYALDRCNGIDNLIIIEIKLEKITGKRNLPVPE